VPPHLSFLRARSHFHATYYFAHNCCTISLSLSQPHWLNKASVYVRVYVCVCVESPVRSRGNAWHLSVVRVLRVWCCIQDSCRPPQALVDYPLAAGCTYLPHLWTPLQHQLCHEATFPDSPDACQQHGRSTQPVYVLPTSVDCPDRLFAECKRWR